MTNAWMPLALLMGLGAALPAAAQSPTTEDSLQLRVDGMVCSLCAYGVERRLGKLDPVEQVEVKLDSGLVVVVLKRGTTVSDSTLSEEVRRAGFTLRAVQRFRREPSGGSP